MKGRACQRRVEIEAWSRRGSRAALPGELRGHAASCEACSALVAEVEGLRAEFAALEPPMVDERRFDEMRFALMAEARRSQRTMSPPASAHRLHARRFALLAAAAMLLVGLAWASGRLPPFSLVPSPPPPPLQTQSRPQSPSHDETTDRALPNPPASLAPAHAEPAPEAAPTLVEAPEAADAERATLTSPTPKRAPKRPLASTGEASPITTSPAPPPASTAPPSKPTTVGPNTKAPPASAARDDANASASSGASGQPSQDDIAFRAAWERLHAGRAAEAAKAFDELSRRPSLDQGRRADALYWAARSYQQAGDLGSAQSRAEQLAEREPSAWHAPQAALMVGEALARKGDVAGARRWLERARNSGHAEVRARAEARLAELPR